MEKQKSFNEEMYVVLSRVTIIDNLFLTEQYNSDIFKVDGNAFIEYSRLQENRLGRSYTVYVDCNSLAVSMLNAWPLKRHDADISRARQLTDNDI